MVAFPHPRRAHPGPYVAFALVLGAAAARAETTRAPVAVQAVVLAKVLNYVRTLPKENREVLAVGGDPKALREIAAALAAAGLRASTASCANVGASTTQLIYLAAACPAASALGGRLLVTGVPSLVESGVAAIGVGVGGGKPVILVHLKSLRASGHKVDARILALATVIR